MAIQSRNVQTAAPQPEPKSFSYSDNNTIAQRVAQESWDKGEYGKGAAQAIGATVGAVTNPIIDGAMGAGRQIKGFGQGLFGIEDSPNAPAATSPATPAIAAAVPPKTGQDPMTGAGVDVAPNAKNVDAPVGTQVRDGVYQYGKNSFSDSPNGMGFGNFTGQPNAQNMNAADALSARYGNEARGMALGGSQAPQVNAPTVLSSANDWASRNALRNMEVGANSIMNRPGGASGSVSGGRGRGRAQQQSSDPTGSVARYNAAVSADLQKQGMQPQGDLAAMKENAALQREGLQQDGANNRLSSQNDLKRQELGMLADKNAQDSQMRGFDFRQAQRKEGILSQYDQAKTPEARDALIKQFPDVFGRDKNATWKGIALQGGTDALGNKTESTLAAYNEGTGEFRRFDQGAQQQSAGKKEIAVGSTSTVNGKTAVWDGSKWVPRKG